MIHPAWKKMLSCIREMLDSRGMEHIAILEKSEGTPISLEELLSEHETSNVYFDEYVTFEPVDPKWRVYCIDGEGAENDEWIEQAKLTDYHETPFISLSGEGKWEMCFTYDQGCLPKETFEDKETFLKRLIDYLSEHYEDDVYILKVTCSLNGDCSWGRD